jgi:hypothetical protein
MRKREWELLFSTYDLRGVLDAHIAKIGDAVLRIGRERFPPASDELLAAEVASGLVVSPLSLAENQIEVSTADTKIDVSNDFERAVWDRSQPTYVDGIEVTYHVPYGGDHNLWRCRPSSFTLNPPRAIVADDELRFPYDRPDRNLEATKRDFQEDLGRLKQWLPWVNDQVDAYNAELETKVRQRVAARRAELSAEKQQIAQLGYKVRGEATRQTDGPPTPQQRQGRRATQRQKAGREYDVALSFAGEDRAYVEEVAKGLKDAEVSVFYDAFEQVNLWGSDLAAHLGEIYGKRSRFVVLFLSQFYAAKAWPNHERQFAIAQQLATGKQHILPVRFDDTAIPGVPPTIGYLDLRALSPAKLVELVRQKIDAPDADA